MKRIYSILPMLALLLGFGANAQVCYVNDPAGTGALTIVSLPTGWSVDLADPLLVTIWTGDLVIVDAGAPNPTFGCNPLVNGGAVSGNIAFVDRGTCEFGVKSLNAQDAGAIAVVICNNLNAPPAAMGAGAAGANVTIPVVMIDNVECTAIKALLQGGATVNVSIGRDLNLPHDLKTSKDSIIVAPVFAMPFHQIRAATDYEVTLGGIVTNVGTSTETNVRMFGNVDYVDPNGGGLINLFNNRWSLQSLDPDAYYGDVIGSPLDVFPPNKGVYELSYDVIADSADNLPDDNAYDGSFLVTDSTFAICRINPVTMNQVSGSGLRSSTGNSMIWGVFMPIKYGADAVCKTVAFSGAVNAPDSLTGITTTAYVYEWRDVNNDSFLNDMAELTLVGSNYGYPYPSVPNYTQVTTDIYDLNFGPLYLADNTIYFVAIEYTDQAVRPYFYNTDGAINYDVQNRVSGFQEQALNVDGTLYSGFNGGAVPVIIVNVIDTILNYVDVTPIALSSAKVVVLPNPVTNTLNVNVAFPFAESNVYYQIVDMQGRAVMFEKRGTVTSETFTHDVSNLANGTYYFSVKSTSGRQTVSFTAAR